MTLLLLILVSCLLQLPRATEAASPAQGTVSASSPKVSWSGELTGSYAAWAPSYLGGSLAQPVPAPCQQPTCDRFILHVATGGRDLAIQVKSGVGEIIGVTVTDPSGGLTYVSGEPVAKALLGGAKAGDYTIDVTSKATEADHYTATATSVAVPRGARRTPDLTYRKTKVTMRDGVQLAVEIWRPVASWKVPVILYFTPYHVLDAGTNATTMPREAAAAMVRRGYAFAIADIRGTYGSGGCWDYGGLKEQRDAHDLVQWLGTRSWSNGKVAMTGVSYPGTTPMQAAIQRPSHLAAIIPISGVSRWYDYAYQQGTRATLSGDNADPDPPGVTPADFMTAYGVGPHGPRVCDYAEHALKGYSTQPDYGTFWKTRDYVARAGRATVPMLLSHGQLDFNVKTWSGTKFWQAYGGPKWMVLGNWAHSAPGPLYPAWNSMLMKFLDRYLYGDRNGFAARTPRVHVQLNTGAWVQQRGWSPELAPWRSYPLKGAGTHTIVDDGLLTESEVMNGVGEGVRWLRVPVAGTTGPFRFGGRPRLDATISADQPSTHVTALLLDVDAAGTAKIISRAFMDARYRNGLETAVPLVPGQPAVLRLEFIDKDYVVLAGHHLELRIATSSSTWVLSDTNHATVDFDLDRSFLRLPVYPQR